MRAGNQAQMEQVYHMISWGLYQDTILVNRIISEDACWTSLDCLG